MLESRKTEFFTQKQKEEENVCVELVKETLFHLSLVYMNHLSGVNEKRESLNFFY